MSLVYSTHLTAPSSSLPQRLINSSRSSLCKDSMTIYRNSCRKKMWLVMFELLILIAQLSEKFYVPNISSDRNLTSFKGHIRSKNVEKRRHPDRLSQSFTSLTMQKQSPVRGGGWGGREWKKQNERRGQLFKACTHLPLAFLWCEKYLRPSSGTCDK